MDGFKYSLQIWYVKKITRDILVYVYAQVLLSSPIFFSESAHLNFREVRVFLSVTPAVCCPDERLFSVF